MHVIDPRFMRLVHGLELRAYSNGDGTVTLEWDGFNLEAIDPSGEWVVEESLDGSSWSTAFTTSPGQLGDDWGAGTLGVVNYFRVKARDSNPTVLKTSNTVSVTLPEPWEMTGARRWDDFESDTVTTVTGRRLTRSGLQYYTCPHASDLNLTTGMTVLMWVNNAVTVNNENAVYISKGTIGGTPTGWHISTIGGGVNYSGEGVRLWNSTGGLSSASTADSISEKYVSAWALRFNAGTTKVQKNGSDKSITGTVTSPLATNTDTLKIGVDLGAVTTYSYRYGDFSFAQLAIWNRSLSDAEITALNTGGNAPIAYADLEAAYTGITSGLIRCWENGELQCKVTSGANGLLTPVVTSGTIDAQERIVSHTDRASGITTTATYGRAPRLRSSVIGTAPSAHCDSLDDAAGTVGLSRCDMRAALTEDVFDANETTILNLYRLDTAQSPVEAWLGAVDNSGSTLDYVLTHGYTLRGGALRPYTRFKRTTAPAMNGGWYASDATVALNTNYKEIWTVNSSGTPTIEVNDVAKTPVADFGGPNPTPDGVLQSYIGMAIDGGGPAIGNKAIGGVWNRVLTAAQIAQVKAWVLANYGV